MTKYAFEVVAHGRVNVIVEADNEEDAREKVWDSPDVPEFDKIYDMDINLIGEV